MVFGVAGVLKEMRRINIWGWPDAVVLVVPGAYYRAGCAGYVLKKEAALKKKEYVQVPSHRYMPGRLA